MVNIKKKVGQVTIEEKNEILCLFERKTGLMELLAILNNNNFQEKDQNSLYDKAVSDLGHTKVEFDQWWKAKSQHYNWESNPNGNWEVDFTTNEIYLVVSQ